MTNNAMFKLAQNAKKASRTSACLSAQQKSAILKKVAAYLQQSCAAILQANARDVAAAKKRKLTAALIDRLTLTTDRVKAMAQSVLDIAAWPDPIGQIVQERTTAQSIHLQKIRVPLGVVCMVYESRPNVTIEAAALCFKAGNAVILRGGREALHSNKALAEVFKRALKDFDLSSDIVSFVDHPDHKNIYDLAQLDQCIDLLIARGSEAMVRQIRQQALVPVLGHGKGVCHVYVDAKADLKMALDIAYNAKVQRPGVCNAMESLVVHRAIAGRFLPAIAQKYQQAGVELFADAAARKILPQAHLARLENYGKEYLDLALTIKVVDSLSQAIEHIQKYSSGHTDTIVTRDKKAAKLFLAQVDSAAVFHNVSTRMHDGGMFGLGAEIGISTQKLHARGAMGALELTSTKYVGVGTGQIRQ